MKRYILGLLALTTCALMAACSPSPQAQQKIVIAVQPTNTPEQLSSQAKELESFLEQRTGADVDILFPTTFAGVIEALRFGHAHAAFMSAWPASLAQSRGAELVLAEIRQVAIDDKMVEAPYYYSYWIVKKDSPYSSLSDLKGLKAALPSQLSTSGYVAPVGRMVELGLVSAEVGKQADPKGFFGEVLYAGGYAQGWEALKAGQVDVTVIAGDVAESLYKEVLGNSKIIEKQGPVPSHAVVFSKNLEEPYRTKLKDALLALGTPEYRDLMRKFISGIFVSFKPTTSEEHLADLNKYLKLTNFEFVERLR
ncbi:MAG: phosphate/phosphite/phosphonate ABC transporter substrate-binding protein [Dehalococcoidia bacterium]|nr:phosphate/phosphite/phosphonate ABC transporter substrate-binding protein [Dehalococcoidia bacterium]